MSIERLEMVSIRSFKTLLAMRDFFSDIFGK